MTTGQLPADIARSRRPLIAAEFHQFADVPRSATASRRWHRCSNISLRTTCGDAQTRSKALNARNQKAAKARHRRLAIIRRASYWGRPRPRPSSVSGKGGKTRYLPLHPGTQGTRFTITSMPPVMAPMNMVVCSGRCGTNHRPARQRDHAGWHLQAGARYSAELGFEIGAPALRATAATNALDHEADIAKVQESLSPDWGFADQSIRAAPAIHQWQPFKLPRSMADSGEKGPIGLR